MPGIETEFRHVLVACHNSFGQGLSRHFGAHPAVFLVRNDLGEGPGREHDRRCARPLRFDVDETERLALFDLAPAEIERLHGPVGLDLGGKTPAEIAVSILAEIIAVKNGVALMQKKEGSALPASSAVCVSAG